MTPGTQPHNVSKNTINMDPHPLSITAKGGNRIESKTLNNDIRIDFMLAKIIILSFKKHWILMRYFL